MKVIHEVGTKMKERIEVVGTYLGAHSIPKNTNVKEYTKDILQNQLPTLKVITKKKKIFNFLSQYQIFQTF